MKTLVIHPSDITTDFLAAVYPKNATIIRTDISDSLLIDLIKAHDLIILLGHGISNGLIGCERIMINRTFVPYLKDKLCICIWCYASDFVKENNLKTPFSTGMFISELGEAYQNSVTTDHFELENSNNDFAKIVGAALEYSLIENDFNLLKDRIYSEYANATPLRAFNANLFYSNSSNLY